MIYQTIEEARKHVTPKPLPPIIDGFGEDVMWACPNCESVLRFDSKCRHCGQLIRWY